MADFTENGWKGLSVAFGGIGLILTCFSVPSAIDLGKVLMSKKLSCKEISPEHNGKYVTITGQVSPLNSFPVTFTQTKSNPSINAVFSRYKTVTHSIPLSNKKFFKKELKQTSFSIGPDDTFIIYPSSTTLVKGVEILNETKYNIPDFLSLLLTVVEIIFSPICLALGIQKEIGHTTKENVLAVGSLASISGKLIISSGGLEIVPDYITPAYWKTRRLVVWKYLKFLPFQILFLSIGCYFYYRAKKCKSALEKPTKVLNANQDFRCGKCGKNCMVMFEPCLDISLCKECAENCKVCPKCEKEVESQVEIHVA